MDPGDPAQVARSGSTSLTESSRMKRTTSTESPRSVNRSDQPLTTSLIQKLDRLMDELIHEVRHGGQGPSPSLPHGIPQPTSPQRELGAPIPMGDTAPRVDLPGESCHPPGDVITLDRLQAIANQVDGLQLLGVSFTSDRLEIMDHDPRAGAFPFRELVQLAQLYAAGDQATDRVAAVRLMSSCLPHIPLPVSPQQWPAIRDGLDLLNKHFFSALMAGWTPPQGWESRWGCLGQIQLYRTLLNPHLSPEQCLEELVRSEHAVRLMKRELLQKPAPWTPALRQLSRMLWALAPTLSGDVVSTPSLNDQLRYRLFKEGEDDLSDSDRMALSVQGLFELCPGTYGTHAAAGNGIPDPGITSPPGSHGF